ncbi:hypothetical protein CFter6_5048 [Collimonas fungivorans]|uniref:Uncharacterized protein n=1 Tax=Collimonas fungivorans TaxID=158899 RepID=A0A127PIJ8_9BURK|nr:hypothetical protein CFter6_5048 [Collimonas fungivorans]
MEMYLTVFPIFENEKIFGWGKCRAINAAAGAVIISLE